MSGESLWSRALRAWSPEDVEDLHALALRFSETAARIPGLLPWIGGGRVRAPEPLHVGGLAFANPVGLAAGFDKSADWLPLLPAFGFGFAEIGTVTPQPQGGNPRPRLFRDVATQTIRNRMGFNNLGAQLISEKVVRHRAAGKIPDDFRVGVNIGKNRTTEDSAAVQDYVRALAPFRDAVDFAVINVSSPNTPGLRALQNPETLTQIVEACRAEVARWPRACPLWVKLAPEFSVALAGSGQLEDFLSQVTRSGAQGWVLTNTLASPEGGLSGLPVQALARAALAAFRPKTVLPVISTGGILDLAEAQARLNAGAQLVEVYSGWIFGGPRFVSRLAHGLKPGK